MSEERYEIRGKIGQGGVGAVYRAYDTQLRREVAIKRVLAEEEDPEGLVDTEVATKNLLKEATALSSVQHPHICTVYDAGIDKEGPYVVMELINGKTLDEMVERGTLTFDDFREVAIQSQEAMIAAQDLDLVHRDLKPSNVMVCWLPSGRFQVKLVDFGLAKFSAKPSLQTIDHGDAVFGSIFFMAPEQFERTPLDRRTDMYALGCMYYYSLAGTYPFNGDSAPQVMASHLQNSVQPLQELRPDLPLWVCEWVMWHLSRSMDDRPESARVALEKFLLDETTAAANSGVMPQRTGPQLITPATNTTIQPTQPAIPSTTVNTKTAPQSITPPDGARVLTGAQPVRPAASTITGATAIQPARPYIAPNTPQSVQQQTTQNQTAEPATSPQLHPNAAQGANDPAKKKKMLIAALGGALLLTGGFIVKGVFFNDAKEFNALVELAADNSVSSIPLTQKQANILIASLSDDEVADKTYIFKALLKAEPESGVALNDLIFAEATKGATPKKTKDTLARILLQKDDDALIQQMLEYSADNPDSSISTSILKHTAKNATEGQLDILLNILETTKSSGNRTLAEASLDTLISASNDKNSIADSLANASDASVNKPFKLSMLRLLGATGTTKAEGTIFKALKSDDSAERIAASTAFGKWPNDKPFDAMLTAYIDDESAEAKRKIFENTVKLLSSKRPHGQDVGQNWIQLAGYTDTPGRKKRIIQTALKSKAPWSRSVITFFTDSSHSADVQNYAKRSLQQL